MNTKLVFRVLGIVFALGGVALLVGLWMTNNQDYSFIPLLLVGVALLFTRLAKG